jgi:coenzyme F420 biosynthesis associated uncharacterized protein
MRQPSVDWDAAGRWAGRVSPAGPTPFRAEAARVVSDLRDAAERARPLALDASGLGAVVDAHPGRTPVLVVDRAGWSRAAATSFRHMVDGIPLPGATGQAASVLALLSTRVLGQFDPYTERLLLVAPNVLHSEAQLRVEPADFRLWVCVHEQTHALQFAAAPWLAGYLKDEVAGLLRAVADTGGGTEAGAVLSGLTRAARGGSRRGWSVLDLLPASQRTVVERVTAVMALLEGHADVSMDAVGTDAIPSAPRLRKRLDARRESTNPADVLLRRLLSLDLKLAQYREGASFVRAVRKIGGPHALDPVWSGPDALPRPSEIVDARAWVRRVG